MSCRNCGHDRHSIREDEHCLTYVAGQGWCDCVGYVPDGRPKKVAAFVEHSKSMHRKFYDDTKRFRDHSVSDYEKKNRKRAPLSLSERMKIHGISI
jgi:hypothetical protein